MRHLPAAFFNAPGPTAGSGVPVQEIDLADALGRLELKQVVAQFGVHVPAVDEGDVLRLVHLPLEGDHELARQRLVAGVDPDLPVQDPCELKMIDPVPMIEHWLARAGVGAGPDPTPAQQRDLDLAFDVARRLGSYDIGQTVAVRDGMVAAVEALEGTDAALRRAAALVGAGLVVAKAAKPGQDMRFDRPAIGPATVELLAEIGAAMIGVEAGVALILERDRTLELARSKNVTIYGYAETDG